MTKTVYKKSLKDGANIVALDKEVADYHLDGLSILLDPSGQDTGCSCRGRSSEDEVQVV